MKTLPTSLATSAVLHLQRVGMPAAIRTTARWRVRLSWCALLYGGSLSSGLLIVNLLRWLLSLP